MGLTLAECVSVVKSQRDAALQREARLREALTWAGGFIQCNDVRTAAGPGTAYEDYRNAADMVSGRDGLMFGEFQMALARAEIAEWERDETRALNLALADRLHICSTLLGRCAEKGGLTEMDAEWFRGQLLPGASGE